MLSQGYFLNISESGEKAANLSLILDFNQSGLWFKKCLFFFFFPPWQKKQTMRFSHYICRQICSYFLQLSMVFLVGNYGNIYVFLHFYTSFVKLIREGTKLPFHLKKKEKEASLGRLLTSTKWSFTLYHNFNKQRCSVHCSNIVLHSHSLLQS